VATFPAVSRIARAQAYPARPVRFIVASAPGGVNDILARLIGQWLSERLGQPFVIDNRPGGGTNIATEAVVRAPGDGYTILLVGPPAAINATLYERLNFNFIRDIAPVASLSREPNVMEVHPSFPAKTVAEFIAHAKANPGKLNMASAGSGTGPHLAGELFKMLTGVDLVHVPYRGGSPAVTDLLGGQVQVYFGNLAGSIEHIRAGRLRALAVTTATRTQTLPDIPTLGDFVPGYEASSVYGLGVPKNTPRYCRHAQHGRQRRARRSRTKGSACQAGRHGARRLARRFRQAHRRGNRKVGQGHSGRQNQAGVGLT
jgi:tripartite-type tricarboxylate transporter receptor subunit TctC